MKFLFCFLLIFLYLSPVPSVFAGPVTDGMVAYWQFDGSADDSSGRGNNGTLQGDASFIALTPSFNQSLYLDGSGDYVIVADDDDLDFTTAFSATLWINPSTVSDGWKMLFSKWLWGGGTSRNYDFRLSNDDIFVGVNQSWDTIPADVQLDEWQQIGFTYDNSVVKVYYNGAYLGQWSRSGPLGVNSTHFLIGATPYRDPDSVYTSWHYYGYMDEFKLFNRTLTDTEIAQEYNYVLQATEEPAIPEPSGCILLTVSIIALIKKKRLRRN